MKPFVFKIDPKELSQFVKPQQEKQFEKEKVYQMNQTNKVSVKQHSIIKEDQKIYSQFNQYVNPNQIQQTHDDQFELNKNNKHEDVPIIKNRSTTLYSTGSTLPESASKNSISNYQQKVQELSQSMSGSSLGWDEIFSQTTPTSFQMFQFKNKRRCEPQSQTTQFQINLQNIPKDNRTTLMIKNIPNKYTQPLLLEEIDVNNKDTYNFFYLPIDFTNKCNVGYAFINFHDPKDIPKFFEEFHNKKWTKFNSEKICQITYARIQGVEQLQGHFQYSTIMQEKDRRLKPIFKNNSDKKLKRK